MDGAKRAPAAERDTCDAADRRSAIVVTVAVKGAGRFVPGRTGFILPLKKLMKRDG